MAQTYIYIALAFAIGFIGAWVIRTVAVQNIKKNLKRNEGLLESERLMKEKLRKENILVYQAKEAMETDLGRKLKDAEVLNRIMDEDILLLQKSNEETEALLRAGEPALHALKLKLIEANNTIARLKAQLTEKSKSF